MIQYTWKERLHEVPDPLLIAINIFLLTCSSDCDREDISCWEGGGELLQRDLDIHKNNLLSFMNS